MKTKTIKNVTTALFLGAIGSGIWSLAGEPVFLWSVDKFILVAQMVNDGYYDLLHENIGKSFHEEHGLFFRQLHTFIFACIVFALPVFAYKAHKRAQNIKNSSDKDDEENIETRIIGIQKKAKTLFIVSVVYSLFAAPYFVSRIITHQYNNNAIVFIERSIEIISPVVEAKKIIELRADYRSISDADGFYKLYDQLQSISKTNEIKLPEFDVARK